MGNLKLHEGTIFIIHSSAFKNPLASAHFGGTYTKIGTIQRRLAWPLRKDDTQIREAFHIFHIILLKKKPVDTDVNRIIYIGQGQPHCAAEQSKVRAKSGWQCQQAKAWHNDFWRPFQVHRQQGKVQSMLGLEPWPGSSVG